MPAVAALGLSRAAVAILRRTQPAPPWAVVTCRSTDGLARVYQRRLLDAVVVAPRRDLLAVVAAVRRRYPTIPVLGFAPVRSEEAAPLAQWRAELLSGLIVEGVDDPVAGELLRRAGMAADRRRLLSQGPRLLRLADPLQRAVWDIVVREVEVPLRSEELALRLGCSREHLSRQFAAGGAPNLKRLIDLVRVVAAGQLLASPGYGAPDAARLLHFSSASHLAATARRVASVSLADLPGLSPRELLGRFARGRTRSRL